MLRVRDDRAVNQNNVPPCDQLWEVHFETVHESGMCSMVIIDVRRGHQSWLDIRWFKMSMTVAVCGILEILKSARRYDRVCT